jgi:integrase/recombinase XerD
MAKVPSQHGSEPLPRLGHPEEGPRTLANLMDIYLAALEVRNFTRATIVGKHVHLSYFLDWASERGITKASEVTKPILDRYARWLYLYRKKDGEPLSFRSQFGRLTIVRAFFSWSCRHNHLLYNPASELELPKIGRRLPKHVLTPQEVERILCIPYLSTAAGLRDRAILETFYSTGIRRMELVHLRRYDVDVDRGTLLVRQGKGHRDRMVPIGERALQWIDKYFSDARPHLVVEPDEGVVFLTREGQAFTPNRLTQLVRDHIDAADIGKRGSCHLFRHTMATALLENGCDVRYIQEMLGHVKMETTQIYTQVSIRQLKKMHSVFHPAKAGGKSLIAGADDDDQIGRASCRERV